MSNLIFILATGSIVIGLLAAITLQFVDFILKGKDDDEAM